MDPIKRGRTADLMVIAERRAEADKLSLPRRVSRGVCSSLEFLQTLAPAMPLGLRIALALENNGGLR